MLFFFVLLFMFFLISQKTALEWTLTYLCNDKVNLYILQVKNKTHPPPPPPQKKKNKKKKHVPYDSAYFWLWQSVLWTSADNSQPQLQTIELFSYTRTKFKMSNTFCYSSLRYTHLLEALCFVCFAIVFNPCNLSTSEIKMKMISMLASWLWILLLEYRGIELLASVSCL